MNIITLDFESYYSQDYSLSKITTEEYIRGDQFEVIGVSTKVNDGPIIWTTGDHKTIKNHLKSLPWDDHLLLCQHTAFDGAILNWIFGIIPAGYLDTMSMANALHGLAESSSLANLAKLYGEVEKGTAVVMAKGKHRLDFTPSEIEEYGEYCNHDVELCYNIFHKMLPNFPKEELRVIDLTIRMYTEPVLVLDKQMLVEDLSAIRAAKRTSLLTLMKALGVKGEGALKKQVMSNDKFAELLKSRGIDPPTKVSLKTGKEAWAFAKTDEEFTDLGDSEDPIVATLVATRLESRSTIMESRTEAFVEIAERGAFPFSLTYSGAKRTHRWSGCLVAETEVLVYDYLHGMKTKSIVNVLPDDLVWDGVEFVEHDGVKFSGYREVIDYGGISATPEHIVFTECGKEVSLVQAANAGYDLEVPTGPNEHQVAAARIRALAKKQ